MNQRSIHSESCPNTKVLFVDVIIPLPISRLFTYQVPKEFQKFQLIGCRVVVPFGSKKIITGVVASVHDTPPKKYEARPLLEILEVTPSINPLQMKLLFWISTYYMCDIGQVLHICLPSGLKISSESRIQLYNEEYFESDEIIFSEKEEIILKALKQNDSLSYNEINQVVKFNNAFSVINSLVQKKAVIIFQELKEKYKPKKVKKIRLTKTYADENKLNQLFQKLNNFPKQEAILLFYLQEISIQKLKLFNEKGLDKNYFKNRNLSNSSLNTLIKHNIFEQFEVVVSRFGEIENNPDLESIILSSMQERLKDDILDYYKNDDVVLLHGITGSGKTEIYISLINDVLASQAQVLYLLPEIALTTQIVKRLKKVFGDQIGVYHSKFSDNERVEVWQGVISGRFKIILGVRSSVFLPFDNLGLVIIDEEHELSYKQNQLAPRYHARNTALYLAKRHHAKVLLGSATPSLESYFLAKKEKYKLFHLNERYGGGQLPKIELSELTKEFKTKKMTGDFSLKLIDSIQQVLDQNKQAIVFKNRRAYSPYIRCEMCQFIPRCSNCSVSLTLHMYKKQIICHYCGYHEAIPKACDACGSGKLKTVGVGTENLEEQLISIFPKARIQRMDLDSTRRKNSYQEIITKFENKEIDILVGTQMITKGLDFDDVTLVGVVDFDSMARFPDFRSQENTFQLVTQVSGRAGRRNGNGKVVIQTKDSNNKLLEYIINDDYIGFYEDEIREREMYNYPPFSRLISITIKHHIKMVAHQAANKFCIFVNKYIKNISMLGPQEPVVNKIKNKFLVQILIKIERDKPNLDKIKKRLKSIALEVNSDVGLKQTTIIFDVDPC